MVRDFSNKALWLTTATAGIVCLAMAGCSGSQDNSETAGPGTGGGTTPSQIASASSGGSTQLTGAGSTFDKPFFTKAFYVYNQKNPNITVNYQPIGSGGGIKAFTDKTVDFGASDVPMNKDEMAKAVASGGPVLELPVALGAATMAYNVEGVPDGLKLTQKAVADIFLGKVKNWDDPEIGSVNPGVKLPNLPITTVHRADGSGTTYIVTDYLSKISPEFKAKVGVGKSVHWPVGLGAKGNDGVAGQIHETPGAFGYVELAYVLQTKMTAAAVRNKAGDFVSPSLDGAKAAAADFPQVSADQFSIVNGSSPDCYPISGYSWLLLREKPTNPANGKVLTDLVKWLVTDAQGTIAASLDYAPLPDAVQKAAVDSLSKIQS